jgi:ABC-type phosphate/phosphonate transport system substrate-binding protein
MDPRLTRAVATLPMYDWPEVAEATDAFWAALRDGLRARGLPAPDALSRDAAHWTDPDLALSQTCGMPYRLGLHAQVTLVGAPDYGVGGCPPGYYCSVLIARADDMRRTPAEFAEARYAYNDSTSQSGYAALAATLGPLATHRGLRTQAHRASIRAVAGGEADIAAIDAVSWRLAEAWEGAAAAVRVVARTRPTPGLPIITAAGRDPAPYADAVAQAIDGLDPAVRGQLSLRGFVRLTPDAYLAAA